MPQLETETKNLLAALAALRAYAKQSRAMNHIGEIEAVLNAAADYATAADAILNPPPSPLEARVLAHLRQVHLQHRLSEPVHIRQVLASITAFHLPRNPLLDECLR